MVTGIVHVEFHGAELVGRLHQGQPFVAMRPIVEGMGLDWSKQLEKLKSHPVLARQLSTLRGWLPETGRGGRCRRYPCRGSRSGWPQ